MPAWAKGWGGFFAPPDEYKMPAYGAFLTRFAASLGDKMPSYDTWDEPNDYQWYQGTPKQMGEMLELQYKAIKAGNPNATVAALALQTLSVSEGFLKAVFASMSQPVGQFFDVLDWHPYRLGNGEPGPEVAPTVRDEMQTMAQNYGQGKPLWSTEFGWKMRPKFSLPYTPYVNLPMGYPDARTHREEDAANYYVQQVATGFANNVTTQFYYALDEGPMTERWAFGMVGPNQAYPKAIYFAAATMARNTDFAETVRQEKLLDNVFLTTTVRDGTETLLIWKACNTTDYKTTVCAVDVQIEVKDGPILAEDLYGNPFSLDTVDGKAFVTITQTPLYIMRQRADVTISKAAFQLVSHEETIAAGTNTTSLSLSGDVPAACTSGVLLAGFLGANSTAGSLTAAHGMNVLVPADTLIDEVFDAVLWLKAGAQVVGRLLSEVQVCKTGSRPDWGRCPKNQ